MNNLSSDNTTKIFDLRQDLFKKLSEIQSLMSQSLSKKIGNDEFAEALSQKADLNAFRNLLETKASQGELESIRRLHDNLRKDLDLKVNARDLEQHSIAVKNTLEELSKEIMLRANIKDVLSLLDLKANVEDVNSTLQLVQKEVEKCIPEKLLKKALDEQALVNEALCAQNCVGRWIWKSGDLKNTNQVPWEV